MEDGKRIARRLTKIESLLEEISKNILKPPEKDRKITVNESAEILGCTTQAIRNAIHRGELKSKRIGRRYYLSFHEIRERAGYNINEKKD